MNISPSGSASDPGKRTAEAMESERGEKRLRLMSDVSECNNSEGLHSVDYRLKVISYMVEHSRARVEDLDSSENRLLIIAIIERILRLKGLDPNLATEDWNKFRKMLDDAQVASGDDSGTQVVIPKFAGSEKMPRSLDDLLHVGEFGIKSIELFLFDRQLIEELDDCWDDGGDEDIFVYSEPGPVLKTCTSPKLKSSSPPDPHHIDNYCYLCKGYPDHGLHRCPIENNAYEPYLDGGYIQTKCLICREPIHLGRSCNI